MKTKPTILLQLVALCALLLPSSPQLLAQTNTLQPGLKAERGGDKMILRWTGGDNIRLQTSTCLCGPDWQYLPDPDTNCTVEVPMTAPTAFFRLVDANVDTDDDFLTRGEEEDGWTIYVDTSGFGDPRVVEQRHVTSDPEANDTDGDDLEDSLEWLFGTDPRAHDTDRDGLSDGDEVFRWNTSPTSVDTDGDARGPDHNLPPKVQLFDGKEVSLLHTSPTLEDTDGDGRTDYEEYDQPGRSPLVAQLPDLEVQLVDDLDIRLDVQYAEALGQTHQYGSQLTTSTTTTEKHATSHSLQWSLKLGAKSTAGFFNGGVEMSTEFTIGTSHSYSFEKSTADTTQEAITDYTTDSQTRTETAASGSMSGGIQLVNTGPVTYTLTGFGVTVRYWSPGTNGTEGSFKTLATLIPALGAGGITLAPGDRTPVLQVQATGINASRVKEFMSRPNSIYLEPAFYEMENAEGLNFDFLEEVTRWRTARVEIDYGDGRSEQYRVATNVERDENGGYAGVTMGMVMSNILRKPFQTVPLQTLQPTNTTNERVLYAVTNCVNTNNGFWVVVRSGEGAPQEHPNFEDIVLHAGDEILLAFMRDEDGDGLFAPEEQHYGTTDTDTPDVLDARDSDADGLTDVFEARTGWNVVVLSRTNHVFSDPRAADQDADGLTDLQEFEKGTDPTRADTDKDGIPDAMDLFPLFPAKVLYVKADAAPGGTGTNWATALTNLQDALSLARTGLATTTVSNDDVAEIWVAAGVYKPTTSTNIRTARFELVNNTALYGGFAGTETKLSQRNPDPLFNGTVLSGDLNDNDASTYAENPSSFAENSYNVCYAPQSVGPGTTVDGFTITGGCANLTASWADGAGMYCYGNPQLKGLLFRANHAGGIIGGVGGALFVRVQGAELRVSDCLFLQNDAASGGGGIYCYGGTALFLTNCQFYGNVSDSGGALATGPNGVRTTSISIEGCTFRLNSVTNSGGGINMGSSSAMRVSRSRFEENAAVGNILSISVGSGGGIATASGATNITMEVVQSVFFKNSATGFDLPLIGHLPGMGGAIRIGGSSPTISLYVLNSTFCTNFVDGSASGNGSAIDGFNNGQATVYIENSIIGGDLLFGGTAGSRSKVRTSCLSYDLASYPTGGNISADPKFVDSASGNLRLESGSPCLDRGNNYADYYPRIPGFQLLPATDLDGNWRIVDGNSDGNEIVDMGAYERQEP